MLLVFSVQVGAEPSSLINRRNLIKGATALGFIGVGMGSGSAAAAVFDLVAPPEPVDENAATYLRTSLEQHLVMIGEIITVKVMKAAFGVESGNAGMTQKMIEKLLKNPARMWALLTVIAPTVEEALFRYLPAALFGNSWLVGSISAGLFASAHGLKKLPLPQFIGGIWFWYLMKHRGISHAVIAHAVNNNTAAVMMILTKMTGGLPTTSVCRGLLPELIDEEAEQTMLQEDLK